MSSPRYAQTPLKHVKRRSQVCQLASLVFAHHDERREPSSGAGCVRETKRHPEVAEISGDFNFRGQGLNKRRLWQTFAVQWHSHSSDQAATQPGFAVKLPRSSAGGSEETWPSSTRSDAFRVLQQCCLDNSLYPTAFRVCRPRFALSESAHRRGRSIPQRSAFSDSAARTAIYIQQRPAFSDRAQWGAANVYEACFRKAAVHDAAVVHDADSRRTTVKRGEERCERQFSTTCEFLAS